MERVHRAEVNVRHSTYLHGQQRRCFSYETKPETRIIPYALYCLQAAFVLSASLARAVGQVCNL